MKQFALLAFVAAIVLADIDVRIQPRNWGVSPTFMTTTDLVENPCEYIYQQLSIPSELQC